jgi:hypothetical protein
MMARVDDDRDCLDDEVIALFLEGLLAVPEEAVVRRHVNQCTSCRCLLASAARFDSPYLPIHLPPIDRLIAVALAGEGVEPRAHTAPHETASSR